jgi:DNA-binding winged helix-turn-helix (wHTH) protein
MSITTEAAQVTRNDASTRVEIDDGHVDLANGRVVRAGNPETSLAPRELAVLRALVAASGSITREELAAQIAEPDEVPNHRALDHLVFRLRAAIEVVPRRPTRILTERARGYRWVQAAFTPVARPREGQVAPPLIGREGIVAWLRDLNRSGRRFELHGCPGVGLSVLRNAVAVPEGPVSGSAVPVPVPPLDFRAARELFEYRLGRVAGAPVASSDARALAAIVTAMGGHPWSLCRVASRVALIPMPALAELAEDPLALLSSGDRAQLVERFTATPADLDPSLRPEPLWSAARAAGGSVGA